MPVGSSLNSSSAHSDYVRGLTFSPDGRFYISGSDDNNAKIWDTSTFQCVKTLGGHSNYVFCVKVSPDGRLATGAGDNKIRVWDMTSFQQLQTLSDHTGSVYSINWTHDGSRLVSGSGDNSVKVWDMRAYQCISTPGQHSRSVKTVTVTSDDSRAISGSEDKSIKIWNLTTFQCTHTLGSAHTDEIRCIILSSGDAQMISSSDDRSIKFWDLRAILASSSSSSAQPVHTISVSSKVYCLALDSSGVNLFSGDGGNHVEMWDASAPYARKNTFSGSHSTVLALAVSPDGERIVSGCTGGRICVWEGDAAIVITKDKTVDKGIRFFLKWNRSNAGASAAATIEQLRSLRSSVGLESLQQSDLATLFVGAVFTDALLSGREIETHREVLAGLVSSEGSSPREAVDLRRHLVCVFGWLCAVRFPSLGKRFSAVLKMLWDQGLACNVALRGWATPKLSPSLELMLQSHVFLGNRSRAKASAALPFVEADVRQAIDILHAFILTQPGAVLPATDVAKFYEAHPECKAVIQSTGISKLANSANATGKLRSKVERSGIKIFATPPSAAGGGGGGGGAVAATATTAATADEEDIADRNQYSSHAAWSLLSSSQIEGLLSCSSTMDAWMELASSLVP